MAEPRRALIFDPFAGISGDMVLGALVDLGLAPTFLEQLSERLPIEIASLEISTVRRGSLSARAVKMVPDEPSGERGLEEVLRLIRAAEVEPRARELATRVFRHLAEVEASLHGLPVDEVHFHEVGAADAIFDIVGAAAAVVELEIDVFMTRPVAVGQGWVSTAHGQLPLPAPATLRLLEGLPVIETSMEAELTTPTGAALLATLTQGRRAPAHFVPLASGFGAGDRDPDTHPNCLRVVLAQVESEGRMCILQADIDDMSPEDVPPLTESLRRSGAVDVITYPLQMKKGRTGLRIEALTADALREQVTQALLLGSTTIGLRYWHVEREVLPRRTETITWRGQTIRVKATTLPEGHIRRKAEYEDIVRAAGETGVPLAEARNEIRTLLDSL